MQSTIERPRELGWWHVAGLLFGDWGTSRLYVLGLAFALSGHASFWYILAMCVVLAIVGFCYSIICKHYPDGGGVYSAARRRSATLGVIGALLLIADYIITAALSAYVAFRYMLPADSSPQLALYCAMGGLALIGLLNAFGLRRVGFIALVVAALSAVLYAIIAGAGLAGAREVTIASPQGPFHVQWDHFVNVILALSGVEAIANMTGVMRQPVAGNARKAIFVVLIEIVALNLILAWVMNGLPLQSYSETELQDSMMRILAAHYVGDWFAPVAAAGFGLLLLSAANTAIGDMVSIQFMMGRDGELPASFTRLNRYGMPWVGLTVATALPIAILAWVGSHTAALADLYAIGVVGAILLNLLVTGTSSRLRLARWEQGVLVISGLFMACIELTIAIDKPPALMFALAILGAGLLARYIARFARESRRTAAATSTSGRSMEGADSPALALGANLQGTVLARFGTGRHSQLQEPSELAPHASSLSIPAGQARILVPSRGDPRLLEFAAEYAKAHNAGMIVLFVREIPIRLPERGGFGEFALNLAEDPEAQQIFSAARAACEKAGVPMQRIYSVHADAAEMIADHAATYGVDAVLMGISRRGMLWHALRGNVIGQVAAKLPATIPLVIHS